MKEIVGYFEFFIIGMITKEEENTTSIMEIIQCLISLTNLTNSKQHLPCLFPFRSKFTFGSQAILSGRQSDGRVIVGEPETKCS